MKKVDFEENVEVQLSDKEGRAVKITCDGPLEIEYNEGVAVFNNNVTVDNKDGKLYADKTTVFFDNKEKKIVKIVSEGNVKIERENNVTFAQKATYFDADKKIILEGNPRLFYFPKDNENP
jgi:lipopolysaccharide export system protein LptA